MTRLGRRPLLTATAAVAGGITGCLGGLDGEPGVTEEIDPEELLDASDVDTAWLFAPDTTYDFGFMNVYGMVENDNRFRQLGYRTYPALTSFVDTVRTFDVSKLEQATIVDGIDPVESELGAIVLQGSFEQSRVLDDVDRLAFENPEAEIVDETTVGDVRVLQTEADDVIAAADGVSVLASDPFCRAGDRRDRITAIVEAGVGERDRYHERNGEIAELLPRVPSGQLIEVVVASGPQEWPSGIVAYAWSVAVAEGFADISLTAIFETESAAAGTAFDEEMVFGDGFNVLASGTRVDGRVVTFLGTVETQVDRSSESGPTGAGGGV